MRAASTHLALPGPSQTDFSALENRVDPGTTGTKGQLLRHQGGAHPVWQSDRVFDARDDGVLTNVFTNVDQAPNILAAMTRAGWNTGESGGTLTSANSTVVLPAGVIQVGSEIAVNRTLRTALTGDPSMTRLQPLADLNSIIYYDAVGDYSRIENLYFNSPSLPWVAQDVVRIDCSAAMSASVHDFYLRNIRVGDTKYVRGISIGRNSGTSDMAQIFAQNLSIQGAWTSGNVTTFQEGLHLGSSSSGNVLNFSVQTASITGCATNVYVDTVNVTLRDVYIGGGGVAFGGGGNVYLSVDGCRVESCDQFCKIGTASSNGVGEYVFRNLWYSHNHTTTSTAAEFHRPGNVIFENVSWYLPNYPTTQGSMLFDTNGNTGRTVTFRNFNTYAAPEELFNNYGSSWKNVWFIFDGYTRYVSAGTHTYVLRGLYPRTVTANSNVMPYDGIMLVDATAAGRTITFPPAKYHVGREVVIVKTDASANTVAFTLDGTDAFIGNGAALTAQNSTLRVVGSPTGWTVVGRI